MKKIILLPLLMALGGCAFDDSRPQTISYPASLFTCPDNPDPTAVKTDNDLGTFMVQQRGVADICREKLKNVGELVQANQPGGKPQPIKTDKKKNP